ncbi:amino acid adenylation domain-containing protein [Nonomuraea sp. NPDC050663]|uniref:amino acid adenylation domain-containing protein n=1 Tax=Nonomuraea sp. NPDC050663 TaxID=3364370 RepID=UPI00378E1391
MRVHELVAAHAAAAPDDDAIVHGDTVLSYAELDARAERLARRLMAAGVTPDTPVGVFLERSPEFVLAVLAVLKAGGAYVPLDPAYPAARLAMMLEATGAPVVVTTGGLASRLEAPALLVEADGPAADGPLPAVRQDNLAYIMFTSGSTGVPKGASITHRGITRLVVDPGYITLDAGESVLHASSTSFDAATFEIWGALANGARLVIGPAGRPSAHELGALMREQGVTTAFLTTGLFHLMVDECLDDLAGLRQLLTGGDVLSPSRARRLLAELPDVVLVNAYGPTEVTTFTTCQVLTPAMVETDAPVPIGTAINDTWLRVLDDDFLPAEVGHLYAGGGGLARGYLNDPALTAQRFVPDPWLPGERIYATGDLARMGLDGVVEFLGRADQQIKRRGFRVEPVEIEEALRQDPLVRDAGVVAVGADAESKVLVAYLVAAVPGDDVTARVREGLRERLPAYLMPDRWASAESLPLNVNGKLDRPALRALAEAAPAPAQAPVEVAAPEGEVETELARIWRELFEKDEIGRDDDFFELGGHSLLAGRLSARLRGSMGRRMPVSAVFDHPTIAELADYLRRS